MKKVLLICCLLIAALAFSAAAEVIEFGNWELAYYVDEFKLPTSGAYIINSAPIDGTFCNSAVDDAHLKVSFLLDEFNLSFVLYEYGDSKLKNSFPVNRSYDVTMLDDAREKTYMNGTMAASGGDRILFDGNDAVIILNALRTNSALSFYIAETDNPTTNYLFTINDTSGISEAVLALEESVDEADYQAAVKLYNSGKYQDALAAFAALGNYKDSAEWEGKYQAMKYAEAEALLAAGDYAGANNAFVEAGSYSNAAQRVGEPYYIQAEKLLEQGKYAAAINAFALAGEYSDAQQRIPEVYYLWAENLLANKDYDGAIAAFTESGDHRDAKERILEIHYYKAESLLEQQDYDGAIAAFTAAGDYNDAKQRSMELWAEVTVKETICAGVDHTVGLKADGTVAAVGNTIDGQCDVKEWRDIVEVSAGLRHTLGLKPDGTVVAAGINKLGECNISEWQDIVDISAGRVHTVALKADGTVLATGYNDHGQCNVSEWRDIIAVSAGDSHTVGLKSDGTVVAVGYNHTDGQNSGMCNVNDWSDMIAVSAGPSHTVGLKSDGTVVAAGNNQFGQCQISDWQDIIAIEAGWNNTFGLKADGSIVVAVQNGKFTTEMASWHDIVAISANESHAVGLKKDGTLAVASGDINHHDYGQLNVQYLLSDIETIYPTLEKGSKGEEVKALQQALIDHGYLTGAADGAFGNMTAEAIRAAQKVFGMKETGIADHAFQKRLYDNKS